MSDHGTEARYQRGCRCDGCRAAATKARRLRRHGLGPGIVVGQQKHGIVGYRRHGCRCGVCTAANTAMCLRWRHKHRATGGRATERERSKGGGLMTRLISWFRIRRTIRRIRVWYTLGG